MRAKHDELIATRPRTSGAGPTFATLDELRRASAAPDDGQARHDAYALPNGFRINEFEIVRKIGDGGFSVVYLAWDHSLERQVALKEYMPAAIATRTETTQIAPRSENDRETFEAGLRSFVNEGRLLAQFDLTALVKVYRFWQANGTAYMVMPFYQGRTVREVVRAMPSPPDENWLLDVVLPLMDVLDVMHAAHCYHRDIAPDNILLLAESSAPLLLDFGAARRVVGDMTQALTVVLKPGYAPLEQYGDSPDMSQGPWTDVYALAAVLYWAITGKPPAVPITRIVKDTMVTAAEAGRDRYGAPFLQAIDRALTLRPERRTPSIAAFRADLLRGQDRSVAPAEGSGRPSPTDDTSDATRILPARPRVVAASPIDPTRAAAAKRRWAIGAAVTGFVVVAGAVAWRLAAGPSSIVAPAPVTVAPPVATPRPAPDLAATPRAAPVPAPAPPPVATAAPPSPPPAVALGAAIAALRADRDPSIAVEVAPDQAAFEPTGAKRRTVAVRSATAGYVYLFAANDSDQLVLLGDSATNATPVVWSVDVGRWAATPAARGRWDLFAVVSRSPRAFDPDDWIDRDRVRVRARPDASPVASWWGRVACTVATVNCPAGYGLASTAIVVEASQPAPPMRTPAMPTARAPDPRPAPSTTRGRTQAPECAKVMERIAVGETPSAEMLNKCR